MKITPRQKWSIYAGMAAIVLIFASRAFFGNISTKLGALGREVKLAEATLRKNIKVQRAKEEISKEYERFRPFFKLRAEDDRQMFEELLKETERIIRSIGGSVVNLTPEAEPVKRKAYKEYKVAFRIEVNFKQFLRFLSRVQESEYLIKLERLSVATQNDGSGVLRVEGEINLAVAL